ncbi:MAG: SprT family zinc-dependent metalloprotease [Rikenellaceae bacterium]|nr:SprT family zinc-dependent metalloprotease [Rikenellaceae bacterium]
MDKITVSNITIDVIRKDIKNIHLAVYPPTGRVRIAAPLSVNDDAIRLFAISKLGWIKRHQREFDAQERISPREYKQRESHYFQGRRYLMKIIERDEPPKVILRTRTYIELYIRPNTSFEKRQEVITEWYRVELKKLIPGIIEKWEKSLNVTIDEWQVKQMKTNWGTCKIEKKRILINLELAKKPVHCLEYVILHEMVHLLERHHNERFLYYMDTFLPNWKQIRAELNKLPVSHADWEC